MTLHEYAIKNNLFGNKLKGLHLVDDDLYYYGILIAKCVREFFVYAEGKIIYNFLKMDNTNDLNNEYVISDINGEIIAHGGISVNGNLYYYKSDRIYRINDTVDECILEFNCVHGDVTFFNDSIGVENFYLNELNDISYNVFYDYDGRLLMNETKRSFNYSFFVLLAFEFIDTEKFSEYCKKRYLCYDEEFVLDFLEGITCQRKISFDSIETTILKELRDRNLIASSIEKRYYRLKHIILLGRIDSKYLITAFLNIIFINKKISNKGNQFVSDRILSCLEKYYYEMPENEFKSLLLSFSDLEHKLLQEKWKSCEEAIKWKNIL